ncbi:BA14K family protein [Alsobacter sp. SYSU BS001988]
MALRFILGPVLMGVVLVVGVKAMDASPAASAPKAKPAQTASVAAAPLAGGLRNVMLQPGIQPGTTVQAPPATPSIGPQASYASLRSEPAAIASAPQAATNNVVPASAVKKVAKAETRGAAGCATYKSFNPVTQTYRSFDGAVRPCRSAITTAAN